MAEKELQDEINLCLWEIVVYACEVSNAVNTLAVAEDYEAIGNLMADTLIDKHIGLYDLHIEDKKQLERLGMALAEIAE